MNSHCISFFSYLEFIILKFVKIRLVQAKARVRVVTKVVKAKEES